MKGLRIVFGLMAMGLLWLSMPVSAQVASTPKAVAPKATQNDTIRMTWTVSSTTDRKRFYFYGEEGATYKVEWGDGETDTETGYGPNYSVSCYHYYSQAGEYMVLLYGVATAQKKKE